MVRQLTLLKPVVDVDDQHPSPLPRSALVVDSDPAALVMAIKLQDWISDPARLDHELAAAEADATLTPPRRVARMQTVVTALLDDGS